MSNYFDINLFWNARWDEFYQLLTTGSPPLLVVLLGVNTVFLIFYVTRKARQSARLRPSTLYWVQTLMVAANAFVILRSDIIHYVMMAKGII
jgi:hypothetical protein